MVLYGASGHCKVIIDILKGMNQTIDLIIDDNKIEKTFCNIPLGKLDQISEESKLIISIGINATRKNVVKKIEKRFLLQEFAIAIHKNAVVDDTVIIGNGSVIMAGSIINADSVIGKHCIINTKASLDHDNKLQDYVHISPGATLCGDVSVGEGAHIGANSVVIQGLKIGKWCKIGAGTVVINDIPDFATVVGNPGRIIKMNNDK